MALALRHVAGIGLIIIAGFGAGCTHAKVTEKPADVAKPESDEGYILSSYDMSKLGPNQPDYLRDHLKSYGLRPLNESPMQQSVERVRFLWCRWRHPAILFELDFNADGSGVQRSSIWEEESGWRTDKVIPLGKKSLDFYRFGFERWKLYELPWYDGEVTLDGSSWFIELQRGPTYHAIYRASPSTGPVWYFGKMLIEDAIGGPYTPIN